jgi:hypothetical protein
MKAGTSRTSTRTVVTAMAGASAASAAPAPDSLRAFLLPCLVPEFDFPQADTASAIASNDTANSIRRSL